MTVKERLLDGIADRSLKLAVAGIGYVGLPLAVAFAEAGFDVTGIDVSSARVALITQGQSYVEDVPSAPLCGDSSIRIGFAPAWTMPLSRRLTPSSSVFPRR